MTPRVIAANGSYYFISYWCDANSGFPRVWVYSRTPEMAGHTQDTVNYWLSTLLPTLDKTSLKTVQQESAYTNFKCKYTIGADYVNMNDKLEKEEENEHEVEFDLGNGWELEVELEHELALKQEPNMPNPFDAGMIELDQIPMTTTDPIILDMDNPFAY